MGKLFKWISIPFFGWWGRKDQETQIEQMDILNRLNKEVDLLERVNFSGYSIRKSSRVQLSVFSTNLVDLVDWVNLMYVTICENDYSPHRWKGVKRVYHTVMMDEYFSEDGHDIMPETAVRAMLPKLKKVCELLTTEPNQEPTTRNKYYLRQYKAILEDSIEVIHQLRRML